MSSSDLEGGQFDVGTTSIRLARVGTVVQILFSSSLEAKLLYDELFQKYKHAEENLKSG